jgi:RHS repeat-associated protein
MNARFYDANNQDAWASSKLRRVYDQPRFLTQDTYKGNMYEPMSQNLYTYVGNNPINYVDPTGHFGVEILEWLGIGWGIASAEPTPFGEVVMGVATAAVVTYAVVDYGVDVIERNMQIAFALGMVIGEAFVSDSTRDNDYEVRDADDTGKSGSGNQPPKPSVPYPGDDSSKPPGEGWEWRGQEGSKPGDPNGNWYNPQTGESLNPDINHGPPQGPHWDYKPFKGSEWYRWFPNGDVLPKH